MAACTRTGLLAVASASPEHDLTQAQAKHFAKDFFRDQFVGRDEAVIDRLLGAYDNAGVETRQLAQPHAWYQQAHGFPSKNAAYIEQALPLARRAGELALQRSGLDPTEIGAIIFASSTGVSTPSLDGRLVQELGLTRDVARVPLWGLGCAGGSAGLARAQAMAIR